MLTSETDKYNISTYFCLLAGCHIASLLVEFLPFQWITLSRSTATLGIFGDGEEKMMICTRGKHANTHHSKKKTNICTT